MKEMIGLPDSDRNFFNFVARILKKDTLAL